jgi:hypothetical protein
MNETKMRMESANCKYCGQVIAFQVPEDSKMTKLELIEEATMHCTCEGANNLKERLFVLKTGEQAIAKIVNGKHEDVKALFQLSLKKIVDGKIKKLTLQVNDTTTISMWMDKGRVKVQKKNLSVSTSDGSSTEETFDEEEFEDKEE